MSFKILAIDDDEVFLKSIEKFLSISDFRIITVSNPLKSLELIREEKFDCVLTDVKMPGMSGVELQKEILKIQPELPIVAISGQSNIPIAIEMIKNGTYDFLEKPVDEEKLLVTIKNAVMKHLLKEENKNILKELTDNYRMIGVSSSFNSVIEKIKIVAPTEAKVLITGETGTGKELVAWAIHHNSNRKSKPYIKLNCASIPTELLESELFGYKKGAFTGADKDREGKFLDEIGEMDFHLQSKLLRILEENEVDIIGENKPIKVNVRIIAATNKNLHELIKENKFRIDLYHRINVFEISIPPLRERAEDIIPLANYFIEKYCEVYNKKTKSISSQLQGILINSFWEGNIRELRNQIEKLIIFSEDEEISIDDYYKVNGTPNAHSENIVFNDTLKQAKEEFERKTILEVLISQDWQIIPAAKILGIERTNLFKKMQKYGIKK